MGPYVPVADPDRDLPVRGLIDLSDYELEREVDRNIGGQRQIAPFNDANSLDDILGSLISASVYPQFVNAEFAALGMLQADLAKAADRIREKLRRNKNADRKFAFENAVRAIEMAKDMYFDRRYQDGESLLHHAEKLLTDGNRKRKT